MSKRKSVFMGMVGGTIVEVASVTDEPAIDLREWSVFEVADGDGARYQFIIGVYLDVEEGRRSTPVLSWDFVARTASTTSGRLYRLHGPPARHPDAMWLWHATAGKIPYVDLSDQIWKSIQERLS